MIKILAVMGVVCVAGFATSSVGQTEIHPEDTIRDSRLVEIQRKMQSIYGRGRPLITVVRSNVFRNRDDRKKNESILSNLLLEVGAEPLLEVYSDNYQFKLVLDGEKYSEYGTITQNLRINFYDVKSQVGERLIMSGSAIISCPEKSSTDYGIQFSSCVLNEKILRELFLRLR